jgi:hypothetical protein
MSKSKGTSESSRATRDFRPAQYLIKGPPATRHSASDTALAATAVTRQHEMGVGTNLRAAEEVDHKSGFRTVSTPSPVVNAPVGDWWVLSG